MPSAFDNKVICFVVTTTTFAILTLSMIIEHQKTLGKQQKTRKQFSKNHKNLGTKIQESPKPWKNKKTNKRFLETLGWTLYLPRLLENCFLFLVFFCFFWFFQFFLFWSKTLEKNGDSWVDPLSPKTFRKLFSFSCVFCFFGSSSFFFLFWSKTLEKMETLGWTLYLPRLLENCFLFLVFFVFLVLPVFFVLVKNLGKNGDSWVDPLSPKTFRKLFSFSCVFRFFGSSSFFLFWSKTLEKMETLGWTLYLPRLLENCFLFLVFFVFLVLPVFFVLVKNLGKKWRLLGGPSISQDF